MLHIFLFYVLFDEFDRLYNILRDYVPIIFNFFKIFIILKISKIFLIRFVSFYHIINLQFEIFIEFKFVIKNIKPSDWVLSEVVSNIFEIDAFLHISDFTRFFRVRKVHRKIESHLNFAAILNIENIIRLDCALPFIIGIMFIKFSNLH